MLPTTDGAGHVTGLSVIVAGYQDTAPANPVTFYPVSAGTTVGPFISPDNPPITITPFTATTTYAASGTPNVTIGASTDRLGFYAGAPVAKQTGVAVTAAGIHAALTSLGLIAP